MKQLYFLFYLISVAVASAAVFLACNKHSNGYSSSQITGTYITSDLKIRIGDSTTTVDVYNDLDYCDKNDKYDFESNLNFYYQGSSDPNGSCQGQDQSGTWSLTGNTLTINLQASGTTGAITISASVLSLNANTMVISYSQKDNNNNNDLVTRTLTRVN